MYIKMLKMKLLLVGSFCVIYFAASCMAVTENSNCGIDTQRPFFPTDGDVTGPSTNEWVALLEYETDRGILYGCSGALVNSRYILTAAHCLTNPKKKLIRVHLGEHNLLTTRICFSNPKHEKYSKIIVTGVEKTIPHEKYVSGDNQHQSKSHDIGIIKLDRPVDGWSKICLPNGNGTATSNFFTNGWGGGLDFVYVRYASKHQTRHLRNLDKKACAKEHHQTALKDDVSCVQAKNMKLACIVDSGGPLMIQYRDQNEVDRTTITGIVHPNSRFCRNKINKPIIYTDVTHYIDWIQSKMLS